MNKTVEHLKERLGKALKETAFLVKAIEEEERATTKFDVRVVVETKGFGEWDWRRMVLSHQELTLHQRDKLVESLRWLRQWESVSY